LSESKRGESKTVFWEIVPGEVCNLKCKNCYAANNVRPDTRILNWEKLKKLLDKIIELKVKKIDLLGGEPLLHPCLEKTIKYFSNRVPDGFCGIVTNGTLITKEKAKKIKNSGVSQITVSLDGTTPMINDMSRGKGSFKQAIKGIHNAIDAGIPITISYTINQFNLENTCDIIPFTQNIGVKAAAVQITDRWGRAIKSMEGTKFNRIKGLDAVCNMYHSFFIMYTDIATRNMFKNFLNLFYNANLIIKDERCEGGLHSFLISSGGDLYPCASYAYYHDGKQRNNGVSLVSESLTTIKKVMRQYKRFNTTMRDTANKKFTTCRNCSYNNFCAPCPLENPSGGVPECEWVRKQTRFLMNKIKKSTLKLLIQPTEKNGNLTFTVPTQKQPIHVPMGEKEFRKLIEASTVSQMIKNVCRDKKESYEKAAYEVIKFLCKLRSHYIIRIRNF